MTTPYFALNFTSGTLSPQISFSRALATATQTNSSGFIENVAADTARFDYNPLTLACKGLLIEEQRLNFALQSEDFSNVIWVKNAVSVAASTSNSPRGTLTAYRMTENTAANLHHLSQTISTSVSTAYTISAYIKDVDRQFVGLSFYSVASPSLYAAASFNLQTGLVVTTAAVGTGYSVTGTSIAPVGNGWYRCSVSVVNGSSVTATRISIGGSTNGSIGGYGLQNYTGTSKSLDVFGAQLEVGASPTSYIPTTTTALTRNADVATITGTSFSDFWQTIKGGASVLATPSTVSGIRPLIQFDDGTANEIIALRGNTTNPELYIVDGGAPQAQLDAGTIAANTAYSLTGWWDTNDCKARQNSGAVVTDTTATIPTVTQMRIGSDGTNYLNGTIATINYYNSFFGQPIYTRRKNKVFPSLL